MTFCGDPFRGPSSGAFEATEGVFWSVFWRVLGAHVAVSDSGFVQHVKKSPLGVFLQAKIKGLRLQKHANRTVHPSKIEGELSVAYVSSIVFKSD